MLITFSGLDGAGKSTLIESLKQALEKRDKGVAVYHINEDIGVYAYLRFVRDALLKAMLARPGKSSAAAPRAHLDDRSRLKQLALRLRNSVVWSKGLRRWVYLIDLVIFLFYRLYVEKLKKQVLITDRYFYDRLVDVDDGRRRLGLRLLELITPTPTVPIYLDISPEEAFARKGEYTIDYLRRRRASYQKVFPWVRSSIILPTSNDVAATARALERAVLERMAAQ